MGKKDRRRSKSPKTPNRKNKDNSVNVKDLIDREKNLISKPMVFEEIPADRLRLSVGYEGMNAVNEKVSDKSYKKSKNSDKGIPEPDFHIFDPKKVTNFQKFRAYYKPFSGLDNYANNCYLNSALQCALYSPALLNMFLSLETTRSFSWSSVMNKFANTAISGQNLDIRAILRNIKDLGLHLGAQDDAHKFLVQLLDRIQVEALDHNEEKFSSATRATTALYSLLSGWLRSTIECKRCGHKSIKYETFLDLTLPIVGQKRTNFKESINEFLKKEEVEGWECESCRKEVVINKYFEVAKYPSSTLVFHICRFKTSFDSRSMKMRTRKLNSHFSFDEELVLDGEKWTLTGIVEHMGRTTNGGHYVAYCRSANGVWYYIDDESVSRISKKDVFRAQAFMLFYSRNYGVDTSCPVPEAQEDLNEIASSESESESQDLVQEEIATQYTEEEYDRLLKLCSVKSLDVVQCDIPPENRCLRAVWRTARVLKKCRDTFIRKELSKMAALKALENEEEDVSTIEHDEESESESENEKNFEDTAVHYKASYDDDGSHATQVSRGVKDTSQLAKRRLKHAHRQNLRQFGQSTDKSVRNRREKRSAYDMEYDTGRVKKIREKKEIEEMDLAKKFNSVKKGEQKYQRKRRSSDRRYKGKHKGGKKQGFNKKKQRN
ncbi:hypothetical protein PCE1_000988 [Barthelona sp. PCE]